MSFRTWISVITVILIALLIYFARDELVHAWHLLGQANLLILLLLIPLQMIIYYSVGEMGFSYLRAKQSISNIKPLSLIRLSLEMNFVNHVMPSGGISGVSYTSWRLSAYGVSPGRATMTQAVRLSMGFVSYAFLLIIALLAITIEGKMNKSTFTISGILLVILIVCLGSCIYLIKSAHRTDKFAKWSSMIINSIVKFITFGRVNQLVDKKKASNLLNTMHIDYIELQNEKKVLLKPFLWGVLMNIGEVSMYIVTFWALGEFIDPALVLVAFGVATVASIISVTPGGAGLYEAIMVGIMTLSGTSASIAIAGIVLTRVTILMTTVILGYIFYQHSIIKHGKSKKSHI